MYNTVLGVSTAGAGAMILPNTGDNNLLTIAAYVSITVGAIILATTLARFLAKKAYKA